MSEESFLFEEKSTNRGFEIIFEVIPAFSLYQFLCLLTTVWLKIPSGAIQLAAVVLQGRVILSLQNLILQLYNSSAMKNQFFQLFNPLALFALFFWSSHPLIRNFL